MEALGRTAGSKLDAARDETGRALHTAASSVRSGGRQSARVIDKVSANAADRLDATATYVQRHSVRGMLRGFGRRHLAISLVAATAAGFLAACAMRKGPHSECADSESA